MIAACSGAQRKFDEIERSERAHTSAAACRLRTDAERFRFLADHKLKLHTNGERFMLRSSQYESRFSLEAIDHVALTVRDVERSAAWYEDVLGLTRLHQDVWGSCPAVVGIGQTSLALFPVVGTHPAGPPGRDTICVRHVAFRVDRANFERAQVELSARGIEVEFQDHQIAHSIYLLDPDGHQLEITTYAL